MTVSSVCLTSTAAKDHDEAESFSTEKGIESSANHAAPPPPVKELNLVEFDSLEDPYMPLNWPFGKKVVTTLCYGLTTCWITFASAIYSAGMSGLGEEFNVNPEVTAAGISLIVFGFAAGPLLWAPLSEVYGRKWTVLGV